MNLFIVQLDDRPGTFNEVAERLAAGGLNVLVYGLSGPAGGTGAFVTADEDGARRVLDEAGVDATDTPLVFARMHDRPGEAARVSRMLADAGVNLRAWLPVDTRAESFTVAIGVDDEQRAREALGDAATDWAYS